MSLIVSDNFSYVPINSQRFLPFLIVYCRSLSSLTVSYLSFLIASPSLLENTTTVPAISSDEWWNWFVSCMTSIKRALFAPVLKEILFQFTTLRFLSLRALGAKISFSASMSSDVDILDPWFLEVGPGSTIGSGCFLSGHFMDKGDFLLDRIQIGSDSLLAARVTVGPATRIGDHCRILFGVNIGVHVCIEDKVTVGAVSDIEGYATITSGVRIGTRSFLHKGVSLERDTKIREEIFTNVKR